MSKVEIKEPIKLRMKPLKNGGQSLYLDIYFNGVRRYEFLHLYLIPEVGKADKGTNKNTLQLAEAIRAKRIVELQNNKHGFNTFERMNADFYEYLLRTAKQAQKHGKTNVRQANGLRDKMKLFCPRPTLPFSMIDKQFIIGFLNFMHTHKAFGVRKYPMKSKTCVLSGNTIYRYYSLLAATLRRAVRDEIIPSNPIDKMPREFLPKAEKSERVFLTEDELRRLYATKTKMSKHSRTIFLFGCATGLRHSDIDTLEWRHITIGDDGVYTLKKKQIKTGVVVEFPMSKAAIALLPKRPKNGSGYVFGKEKIGTTINSTLKTWARKAGIDKNISFHTSRHTFATLALSKGIDLYTVSKLLGHTSIEQTQVYAKVLDETKRTAADMMPTFE